MAATSSATRPPNDDPTTAVRSMPAASRSARTSSAWLNGPGSCGRSPNPRRSGASTRKATLQRPHLRLPHAPVGDSRVEQHHRGKLAALLPDGLAGRRADCLAACLTQHHRPTVASGRPGPGASFVRATVHGRGGDWGLLSRRAGIPLAELVVVAAAQRETGQQQPQQCRDDEHQGEPRSVRCRTSRRSSAPGRRS